MRALAGNSRRIARAAVPKSYTLRLRRFRRHHLDLPRSPGLPPSKEDAADETTTYAFDARPILVVVRLLKIGGA